jgi:hypothetical protein
MEKAPRFWLRGFSVFMARLPGLSPPANIRDALGIEKLTFA